MDSLSHPALLLVDGVSSIGALEFKFDEWKVDVAVTGSQKALSLPTGLAVVAASPKVSNLPTTCSHHLLRQCTAANKPVKPCPASWPCPRDIHASLRRCT